MPPVVGVTEPLGFVGTHLIERLSREATSIIAPYPAEAWDNPLALQHFCGRCDSIVHLAGFDSGDLSALDAPHYTELLLGALRRGSAKPHLVIPRRSANPSSTAPRRAGVGSRSAAGSPLQEWAHATGAGLTWVDVADLFGPGCKPTPGACVATWVQQLARGGDVRLESDNEVALVWVDDLAESISAALISPPAGQTSREAPVCYRGQAQGVIDKLTVLRDRHQLRELSPEPLDSTSARLYATFVACFAPDSGAASSGGGDHLRELVRQTSRGQVFLCTAKPGAIHGDHYHTRKVEWFCVLRGEAVVRFRRVGSREVSELRVSGEEPQFIAIPVMHTHHLENVGSGDLVTMFWTGDAFDAQDPDTHFQRVAA